jgi:hypothetical protein
MGRPISLIKQKVKYNLMNRITLMRSLNATATTRNPIAPCWIPPMPRPWKPCMPDTRMVILKTLETVIARDPHPDWYYPVRHTLGAVLLEAGYPREAEVIYWQDLRRYRDNGYSLFGLWQSLKAQDRMEEARQIESMFNQAWAKADISLSSSRF